MTVTTEIVGRGAERELAREPSSRRGNGRVEEG
jgi:hypothetical protein